MNSISTENPDIAFDSVQAGPLRFTRPFRLETAGRAFVVLVLLASARGTAHAQPAPQNVPTVKAAIDATGVNDLAPIVTYEVGGRQYVAVASGRPSRMWTEQNTGNPLVMIFALDR